MSAFAQNGGPGTPAATTTPAISFAGPDSSAPKYVPKNVPARIARLAEPPVIDGLLNDAAWQNATLFGEFLQTNPGDNVPPKHETEFMIAYDSKHLYMAFRIKQDRSTIRATVARRDNIWSDDYIIMYIDTFNDQRQAYAIGLNPLGIQADGTFTEGRGEDYSVDIVMESKGVLTEDGYTIELAIPFKSLRYEAGKDKKWGLHVFRRVKYNNNELDSWMPNNRSINGSLIQAGKITGMEGIETTRQLEVNPSLTVSETGRRTRFTFNNDPAGRYVNEGLKAEFGMTVKFSLSPTTTLDFAYNPDFAQVEADAPVSTTNVRFPIFFPEKRPFFLERIDIFQTGMNVVNTRAIVDPDIAAKLTGRRGKNTFGIMYASDNAPGNFSVDERESLLHCLRARATSTFCLNERAMDQNAEIGVVRVKRDVGLASNLGFFATTFNFVDRHNNLGGFDGRFKLTPRVVSEFQVVGTNSRRYFYNPNLDRNEYRTGNGFGYRFFVQRQGRNLYMDAGAVGRTADYKADVGFTSRVDTNQASWFIQYQTDRDAKKSIIYKRLFNSSNMSYDWKGNTQGFGSNTQGMLALQRQIYIGTGGFFGYERLFEHEFGPRRSATQAGAFDGEDSERSSHRREVYSFIEATPHKQLFFFGLVSHTWGRLDYDFGAGQKFPRVSAPYLAWKERCAARPDLTTPCSEPRPGLDPGPGDNLYLEGSVRYQPTNALQIQLNYNRSKLTRYDTDRVAFDDNIVSLRSVYQFNRSVFARVRIDYSNVQSRIRPQFVFGWTPSPGKALYVGYNDDVNYNGFNPYTGRYEPRLRGNGRSFYVKMSYLFKRSF